MSFTMELANKLYDFEVVPESRNTQSLDNSRSNLYADNSEVGGKGGGGQSNRSFSRTTSAAKRPDTTDRQIDAENSVRQNDSAIEVNESSII